MAGILGVDIALGVAFTLISFAPMIAQWKAEAPDPNTILVKIGIGAEVSESLQSSYSFQGGIPGIALFDGNGKRFGIKGSSDKGGNNDRGGERDSHQKITVSTLGGGSPPSADYITVSLAGEPRIADGLSTFRNNPPVKWAERDDVCITYVSVNSKAGDDALRTIAVGEVAAECNKVGHDYPWYYSRQTVRITHDGKPLDLRPRCVMLGSPKEDKGTRSSNVMGFTAHLMDFSMGYDKPEWKDWEDDRSQMCGSRARFWMYEKLNERQCPDIFDPAMKFAGQKLPHPSRPACRPDANHFDVHSDLFWEGEPDDAQSDKFFKSGGRISPSFDENLAFKQEGLPDPGWPFGVGPCSNSDTTGLSKEEKLGHDAGGCPTKPRPQRRHAPLRLHEELIVSSHDDQPASALCEDKATRGPDFFSRAENKFCDMDTHTLYPACSPDNDSEEDCFDLQTHRLRQSGPLETRQFRPEYRNVQDWA